MTVTSEESQRADRAAWVAPHPADFSFTAGGGGRGRYVSRSMARVLDACCLRCKVVFCQVTYRVALSLLMLPRGGCTPCGPGFQGRPKHFFQTGRVLPAVRCPGGVLARKLSRKFITDCPVMSCTAALCRRLAGALMSRCSGHSFTVRFMSPLCQHVQQPQLQGMCCTVGCFDLTVFVCRDRRLLSASENRIKICSGLKLALQARGLGSLRLVIGLCFVLSVDPYFSISVECRVWGQRKSGRRCGI